MSTLLWMIIVVVAVIAIAIIGIYNKLVKLNVRTNEAWSDIGVQLKRRYDLIPNLVDTVKGYAKQEKSVFKEVTEARASAIKAKGTKAKGEAENQITEALKSVFAVAESYPELKSNQNFAKLQDELSDTENKIEASRRFYNGNVREMNIAVQTFPTNIFANTLGFRKRDLFEAGEAVKEVPKVNFDEKKKEEEPKSETKPKTEKKEKK